VEGYAARYWLTPKIEVICVFHIRSMSFGGLVAANGQTKHPTSRKLKGGKELKMTPFSVFRLLC